MNTILQKIVAHKKEEVACKSGLIPTQMLEQSIFFETQSVSLKSYLQRKDKSGVIAEIKRKSPSVPSFNPYIDVREVSRAYMQAGASALSILTDEHFFGGSIEDLTVARKYNFCPILRKDFIIDAYQVVETKSIGADAILLIAACLAPQQCQDLAQQAKSLGLEVLLEVHNAQEAEAYVSEHIDILGVNNRNLHTFETSIQTSLDLVSALPAETVKISESGIAKASDMVRLRDVGFDGFLIGGRFMQHHNPGQECAELINDFNKVLA